MKEYVIFFDGVCNLCNGSVNFIIDRDKSKIFRYAALQSEYALETLKPLGVDLNNLNTIILYKNGKIYKKSSAALHIAKELSGLWSLLSVFLIFPLFVRDFFYDIVSRNRYKWFGRKDQCRIPTPEFKQLFLG